MRKKAERGDGPGNIGWIISFADMATILFAFLVLIIGVTAHDGGQPIVGGEGEYARQGDGVLMLADRSLLAPVIELVNNLDQLPDNLAFKQDEFQKAIFQLDPATTPDFQELSEAVKTGVEFMRDNRGLVIKWDRALLFEEGAAELLPNNRPLLEKLAAFLQSVDMPVSLESHTNPLSTVEAERGGTAYALSMKRSRAVLDFLVGLGLDENRFRLGAFGPAQPRTQDPERAWENSRLEIILYRPEASSWRG